MADLQVQTLEVLGATNQVAPALTVSGGLTVATGGQTITAGGITVTAGGLTITAGGLTITAGGLTISAGGASITGASTFVSGGVTVTAGGLTITAGGITVTAGGLTVTAGGLTVTAGGLTVSAGTMALLGAILQLSATASVATPGSNGATIATSAIVSRTAPSAGITGCILAAGTQNGQIVIVTNENVASTANTITFSATIATAFVINDGTNPQVVKCGTAKVFVWFTSLNGGNGAWVPCEPYAG